MKINLGRWGVLHIKFSLDWSLRWGKTERFLLLSAVLMLTALAVRFLWSQDVGLMFFGASILAFAIALHDEVSRIVRWYRRVTLEAKRMFLNHIYRR